MMRHALRPVVILSFFILLASALPAVAADWSDLDEGEHKVFGSEKERKYSINAFFMERENWENHHSFMLLWLYKTTDYPKYTSLRVLPFWYSLSSKIDNRRRTFIPLFLWYNRVQGDENLTVLPFYYSSHDKTSYDRALLWLIWWGGSDAEKFKRAYLFFPVFYRESRRYEDRPDRGSLWVSPLFFASRKIHSFGDTVMTRTLNFSPLHFYSSSSRGTPGSAERAWGAPLIPLIYRSSTPYGGHQNILWIIDYSWWTRDGKDIMKRFWAAPLWFWKPGSDGYSHILPPLVINTRSASGEFYSHFIPFYSRSRSVKHAYSYSEKKYVTTYEKATVTPLYCSFSSATGEKKWEGDIAGSTCWFPVLPLYYSSADHADGSHTNLLWVFDWHRDAAGVRDRFWFIPFYFSGKGSYRHVLPPLYMSWKGEGTATVVSPFWFYQRENIVDGGKTERYSRLWVPIIPFMYTSSSSPEGSHKNVLMALDWSRDASGGLKRFWLLPFFTWKRDSYFHLMPPLYLSWKDADEKSVLTPLWYSWREDNAAGPGAGSRLWVPAIPLLYASSKSPEGSHRNIAMLFDWSWDASDTLTRFWFIPLVFHETGEGGYRHYFPIYFRPSGWTADRGLSFGPFHYNRWSPEKNVSWSYLVHYYRSVPSEKEETSVWAPLYFYWKGKKNSLTILLPAYFDYTSSNRTLMFLAGFTKGVLSGPHPKIMMGIGKQEAGYYVDTDFSLFYDLFSVATRVTLKNPWDGSDANKVVIESAEVGQKTVIDERGKKISFSDKMTPGREDSVFFYGWKFLFGVIAYNRPDSKHHFQIFPLSWITWDDKSDDKVTHILNYLSYKSGDSEYLVFAPLYGKQREGKSHREGYLLFLYWNEYYAEEELTERTVLWPLANWYRSPARSGWRVAPLVWRTTTIKEGARSARTITPLFFSSSMTRISDGVPLRSFSISPLHYYRMRSDADQEKKTWFFPIVPLAFYTSYTYTSRDAAPLIPMKDDGDALPGEREPGYTAKDTASFVFPLYYRGTRSRTALASGRGERESVLVGLPLLYYWSRASLQPGETAERETAIERSIFLLGYYDHWSADKTASSVLFGLYRRSGEPKEGSSKFSLLYGLFSVSSKRGESESWFFPLYYYGTSPAERQFSLLLGLYRDLEYPMRRKSEFSLLYGLFYTSLDHSTRYRLTDGKQTEFGVRERMWWVLPLYYYNKLEGEDAGYGRAGRTHISWLWFKQYKEYASGSYESTFWFPLLPLVYRNATESRVHVNVLGFIDYLNDSGFRENRFWLLPLFYWRTTPDERSRFVLGMYWHASANYSRQNFLYLADFRQHPAERRFGRGFLLGTVDYEVSPDLKSFRLAYGLLLSYSGYRQSDDYKLNVLGFMYEQSWMRGTYRNYVTPLWYYESSGESYSVLIPPLLSYMERESDGDKFQLAGLGALWYRNYKPEANSDRQMLLLGIPYYKVQRRERGYESVGSLWGLLWEIETESETNFSKFSLLKFIYKRVDMNGEVYHRVLGIRF